MRFVLQRRLGRNALCIVAGVVAAGLLKADGLPSLPLGLDAYMPMPAANPLTTDKVALGRRLFFEKRLSRDGTVACSTCHDPELGFTDDKPVAVGVREQKGNRRTPRLVNRGYGRSFFWDGRAASIEEQVLKPIQNPLEMDMTLDEAVARLAGDAKYAESFQEVFGEPPNPESLSFALAAYVRTIVSGNSPYDRYIAGEHDALTNQQQRGLEIFLGKGNCAVCHLGPNLTDEQFHNTGIGRANGKPADEGRFKVTGDRRDLGAFKTPTLREVARTGPYMHDGSLETLEDVVEFYDKGGEKNPQLDFEMQPLDLSDQEKKDLVAFLQALNGTMTEGLQTLAEKP